MSLIFAWGFGIAAAALAVHTLLRERYWCRRERALIERHIDDVARLGRSHVQQLTKAAALTACAHRMVHQALTENRTLKQLMELWRSFSVELLKKHEPEFAEMVMKDIAELEAELALRRARANTAKAGQG